MNTLKVISVSLILFFAIFIDVAFKHYVELGARQSARYDLENMKNCTNEILKDGVVDNNAVEKALKICAGKARTTPTGDAFAFDTKTLDFVFDPSLDCYVEGGKKMTVDSECSLHHDKAECSQALSVMTRGYDSDASTKLSWQFNSGIEYLEFVVLPEELFGYDNIKRGGKEKPHQIVLVQGIQEDELMEKYSKFRLVLFASCAIIMLFTLLLAKCAEVKRDESRQ